MTSRLTKFERNKTDNIEEIIKSRLAYIMCTNIIPQCGLEIDRR